MTLPKLFYFLNFFVRPTVKKRRQKCAKKRQKCAPLTPLTPQNPLFWWEGLRHYLPRVENNITLLFLLNLVSYPYHNKGPKMAPPQPPSAPKPIFLMGEVKKLLTHAKKPITLFLGVFYTPFQKSAKLVRNSAPKLVPPTPLSPQNQIFGWGGMCSN